MPSKKKLSTVVGVFEDRADADRAVVALRAAGFTDAQIGVASRYTEEGEWGEVDGSHWETGAVTGALAGAGLGGLVGLGILAGVIPVIGPVIAGGALATILANAAGGAAIAGLVGALVGAGVPEEEAEFYNTEFEAGRTIVTVTANGRASEATEILRDHGAYDMKTAGSFESKTSTATAARAKGGKTIEVREEELHARKRPVETGEVRVRKEVVTEHKTIDVPVRREEVVVERHPASGRKAGSADIRAGEEIRIPVMEEQVSVEKQAVVKEEVNVGKRVVEETKHVAGDVRKERVKVESKGDVDVRGSRKS